MAAFQKCVETPTQIQPLTSIIYIRALSIAKGQALAQVYYTFRTAQVWRRRQRAWESALYLLAAAIYTSTFFQYTCRRYLKVSFSMITAHNHFSYPNVTFCHHDSPLVCFSIVALVVHVEYWTCHTPKKWRLSYMQDVAIRYASLLQSSHSLDVFQVLSCVSWKRVSWKNKGPNHRKPHKLKLRNTFNKTPPSSGQLKGSWN